MRNPALLILYFRMYFSDISRHQVTLQEAPTHCGYSASQGKDGKIHLILQLNSVCHMSVEASIESDHP